MTKPSKDEVSLPPKTAKLHVTPHWEEGMEGEREANHGNIASMGKLLDSHNTMHQTQKQKLLT